MLFRTHVLFGVFVWCILDLVLEMPLFVLGFVLLGAVFVDIDSGKSRVGRGFWFFSWIFKHRGILHSIWFCFLVSFLIGLWSFWAGFGFGVGYLSHLLIDSFTFAGVRLFWPLKGKVSGFVKSGGWVEDVLFVLLLFLDIGFVVYKFL